ncbi:hypothetical protein B0H12DRAFT_1079729 [Mycena haematopus]|nr:hypothetical protein B0H12DRAFT_1079729 [Mycena haematopus]
MFDAAADIPQGEIKAYRSSDRHGSPAGLGALTRTRTRQNPYPHVRVRVRLNWVLGSGIGRTLNLNFAFSSVRFEFEPKSEPNFPTTNGSVGDPRPVQPGRGYDFLSEEFNLGSLFGVPAAFMSLSGSCLKWNDIPAASARFNTDLRGLRNTFNEFTSIACSQTHQFTRVHTGTRGSSEKSEADPYPYPERPVPGARCGSPDPCRSLIR